MKKLLPYLLALSLIFSLSSFRLPDEAPYSKSQIERFIREVFADQADALFFTGNSDRLTLIEGFLSRIEIRNSAAYAGKKFNLLSGVTLQNKYNPNLIRETIFNPATFNPLKYRLPMTSKNREVFRVDGTDYLLIIQPVK